MLHPEKISFSQPFFPLSRAGKKDSVLKIKSPWGTWIRPPRPWGIEGFGSPAAVTATRPFFRDPLAKKRHSINRWWGCEDPIRFIKDQTGLEKFLIDGIDAIRHWFLGITVAFRLLFEVLRVREILRWVIKLAQPFKKKIRPPYYRILREL